MTSGGRIYLYANDNHLVRVKKYFTAGQRRCFIKQCMDIYDGLGYYFQIDARSPYTRLTEVEQREIEMKKIVRPPSTYDNISIYKY